MNEGEEAGWLVSSMGDAYLELGELKKFGGAGRGGGGGDRARKGCDARLALHSSDSEVRRETKKQTVE